MCIQDINLQFKNEKKITVANLIPEKGTTTYIDNEKYYGSDNFLLREDMCRNDLKKRVEKVFYTEFEKDMFIDTKYRKSTIYTQKEVIEHQIEDGTPYVTLKDGAHVTHIQPKFYKYFKQLGIEFRFSSSGIEPVSLFKQNEWVGLVMPVRLSKLYPEDKREVKADLNTNELSEDDLIFLGIEVNGDLDDLPF